METIDPGHLYKLGNNLPEIKDGTEGPQTLRFIKKEPKSDKDVTLHTVQNGSSTEQVIDVLIHRLGVLYERMPDPYTKAARIFLGQAVSILQQRTADRKERGVLGTNLT